MSPADPRKIFAQPSLQLGTSSPTQAGWQTHPHWEAVAQIVGLVVMSQTSFTVSPITGTQIPNMQKEEGGVTREAPSTKHPQVQSLGNIKMDAQALKNKEISDAYYGVCVSKTECL